MNHVTDFPPTAVRRAAYGALAVSLLHTIFGAMVRISGSGMGCGRNWPKCYGYWFPPFERVDLIIEVTHRYLAIALLVSIVVLVAQVWRYRHLPSVSGVGVADMGREKIPVVDATRESDSVRNEGSASRATVAANSRGSVANTARLALALWFAPAIFGAVTVFTENPAWATVVHKLLAVTLIAVLAVAVMRSGGLGARDIATVRVGYAGKATAAATVAAVLALLVVILGGLTAKIPDAAIACAGFPLCGAGSLGGGAQHVQLTHRVLAYLLALHLISLPFVFRARNEPGVLQRLAWIASGLVILQIVWAAWMVTGGFPGVIRSLHQATGIFIWLTTFSMAYLARIASGKSELAAGKVLRRSLESAGSLEPRTAS